MHAFSQVLCLLVLLVNSWHKSMLTQKILNIFAVSNNWSLLGTLVALSALQAFTSQFSLCTFYCLLLAIASIAASQILLLSCFCAVCLCLRSTTNTDNTKKRPAHQSIPLFSPQKRKRAAFHHGWLIFRQKLRDRSYMCVFRSLGTNWPDVSPAMWGWCEVARIWLRTGERESLRWEIVILILLRRL